MLTDEFRGGLMNLERINRTYRWLVGLSEQWFNMCGNIVALPNDIVGVKNDLIFVSQDVQNVYPTISSELFGLKDNLFSPQGMINSVILGELIALLRFLMNTQKNDDFWNMIHPMIEKTSRKLFEDGHYANASEDAFIEINSRVKKIYKIVNSEKDRVPDGVDAMNTVFSSNNPDVMFADISTDTGKNMQKGYMYMFAGAMSALRNPKAHENISLDKEECKKRLVFASLLMDKLDEGVRYTGIVENIT